MSAATTSQENGRREGDLIGYPMLTAEIIYKGRPVILKASAKTAFTNDGTTNTLANGDIFVGIASETKDNSAGAVSALNVETYQTGDFLMTFSDTLTLADTTKPVYVNNVSDDAVVTVTSDTGNPQITIGKISKFVDATHAYVKIDQSIFAVAANGA